jgi:hypothetical protein
VIGNDHLYLKPSTKNKNCSKFREIYTHDRVESVFYYEVHFRLERRNPGVELNAS